MIGKFEAGFGREGIESLLVGRVEFGSKYEDVSEELERLDTRQREVLFLLVACDRTWSFFETRGGTKNGEIMSQLIRGLVVRLGLIVDKSKRTDVDGTEAKTYYDQLVGQGALEFINQLGAMNVFGTIWEKLNHLDVVLGI